MKNKIKSIGALAVSLALPTQSWAATYNIYFNNAEQGANSKASPTVIVQDPNGKSEGAAAKPEQASATESETAPAKEGGVELEPSSSRSSSKPFLENLGFKNRNRIRLVASATYNETRNTESVSMWDDDPFDRKPWWEEKRETQKNAAGGQLSLTYFFQDHFAGTVNLGTLSGFEGEVLPFGASDGAGVDLGALVGYMSSSFIPVASGSPYIGARVVFNFGKSAGLSLAARKSILWESDFRFAQLDAGLAFYF